MPPRIAGLSGNKCFTFTSLYMLTFSVPVSSISGSSAVYILYYKVHNSSSVIAHNGKIFVIPKYCFYPTFFYKGNMAKSMETKNFLPKVATILGHGVSAVYGGG